MEFPIYGTKVSGVSEFFDLNSPSGRHKYFHAKASEEIEDLKDFLDKNTFLAFLLAKKQAGKGTYSKMLQEIIGSERIKFLSVGDLVRNTHNAFEENSKEKAKILKYLETHYRGYLSLEDAIDALFNRSTEKVSIPNEFLITLIQREIENSPKQSVLLDGFPRTRDQISYSLYLRSIMNLREDPDLFILIDIPRSVIDARMKGRIVCPLCSTSRHTQLLPTSTIKYDEKKAEYKFLCDNPECSGHSKQELVGKEGDHLGIKAIEGRLKTDAELIEMASSLHGISKIMIRNHIPVKQKKLYDDYELTPQYSYDFNKKTNSVIVKESPWIIKDDDGIDSYSLLAAPAVLGLIKQLHKILI